jgi:starch synthase
MIDPASCALSYVPEAYGVSDRNIVGRRSAGREFLKAYATWKPPQSLCCVADTPAHFLSFVDQVAGFGADAGRAYHVTGNDVDALARIGTLYWPDPLIAFPAWTRRALGDDSYSICGITHSLSESRVIAAIQNILVAPLHQWDALICTSAAARRTVQEILMHWADHLKDRFGGSIEIPIQLAVIPLGVDAPGFCRTDAKIASGRVLRQRLGIPDGAVVALYFGRFDFLTKSHPTPTFMAFARAAREVRSIDLRLLMTGQFANPVVEGEIRQLARKFCGDVAVHWVDGSDANASAASWAAADFFVSLPDNLQETFGLTPLEAMASSLPCLVSDWSGLRDTVVDGETGFLVPTRMPSKDQSAMVMTRAAFGAESLDDSMGALSQVVQVDIAYAAKRIALLAENPELRRKLGSSGRGRIERDYDWPIILRRYEEFWHELGAIRGRALKGGPRKAQAALAGHTDPFVAFAHFATWRIGDETTVRFPQSGAPYPLAEILENRSHQLLLPLLVAASDLRDILKFLEERSALSAAAVQARFAHLRQEKVALSLLWMAKFGLIHLEG